jgi:phage minor structural protein
MSQVQVRYPRVCDRTTLTELGRVHPISLTVTENVDPLSTADMQVLTSDMILSPGQFVEICDPYGSLGYYRIQNLSQRYNKGLVQIASMEHGIVTLADSILFGSAEYKKAEYTAYQVLEQILSKQVTQYWTVLTGDEEAVQYLQSVREDFFFENTDLLETLLDFMAQIPEETQLVFDMSAFPWKLIPKKLPTVATSEARLSRNVEELRISYDYSQLCTRLYPRGGGSGEDVVSIKDANEGREYLDSDTQGTWGIVCKEWTDSKADTPAALLTKARKELEKIKNPVLSISMSGQDLSALTGEPLDRFRVGSPIRVVVPEDSVNLTARILSKSHSNLVTNPTSVSLTIGTKDRRKSSAQKIENKGGGGGGGGGTSVTDFFDLVASGSYVTDLVTFTFQLGDWEKIKYVGARLTVTVGTGSAVLGNIRVDGKQITGATAAGGVTAYNLTNALSTTNGAISRGNHTFEINVIVAIQATFTLRISVTGTKPKTDGGNE